MSKIPPEGTKKPTPVVYYAVGIGILVVIAIVAGSIIGARTENKRAAGPITPGATSSPYVTTSPSPPATP